MIYIAIEYVVISYYTSYIELCVCVCVCVCMCVSAITNLTLAYEINKL